jgi:hypothetical protein
MFRLRVLAPRQVASLCTAIFIILTTPLVHAGQFIEATHYAVARTFASTGQVLVADFNLDGNPDLAFGVSFPDGICVMLGSATGELARR